MAESSASTSESGGTLPAKKAKRSNHPVAKVSAEARAKQFEDLQSGKEKTQKVSRTTIVKSKSFTEEFILDYIKVCSMADITQALQASWGSAKGKISSDRVCPKTF